MGFPSSTHQDIHVLRTSKMKTRPWTLRLSGHWLSGSCSTTAAVCWACSSGTSTRFPPRAADMRAFFRARRMSLQNVSQVISRPASESRSRFVCASFRSAPRLRFQTRENRGGGSSAGPLPSNEGRSPSAGLRSCGGESPQRRDRSSPKRRRRHDPTLLDSMDRNSAL